MSWWDGSIPGFEPGTFRLWDLHATKELPRFFTVGKDFLWYLKVYLVLKRFLYYSLPNLESQRKNSQNLHVATWFSPRLVRIWRNKWLCLHYFTLNNVLQHQPKLVNAGLQSSSIFPVLILWNCDFVQKSLAQLLTPKIQLCSGEAACAKSLVKH